MELLHFDFELEFPDDLNQTGSTIQPIKRKQTIEIRLPNAIEFQSNVQILGNIRLVRSRFDWFDRDSIAFD